MAQIPTLNALFGNVPRGGMALLDISVGMNFRSLSSRASVWVRHTVTADFGTEVHSAGVIVNGDWLQSLTAGTFSDV
jgi:hypothetical protein